MAEKIEQNFSILIVLENIFIQNKKYSKIFTVFETTLTFFDLKIY